MTGQPGRRGTVPSPGRRGPSASPGLILALVAALLTTGCIDLATDPLGPEPLEVTASDVEPGDGSGPETRWHTDLRRGTLTNDTGASDRHGFEVPDGTYTLRLGLQSNDGNLTACVQDPDAQRDDGQGWCSTTLETTDGKAAWETPDPPAGTWAVTVERQPGETGNVTYALTIRHELAEGAAPPGQANQATADDQTPTPTTSDPDATTQTPPPGHDYQPHVIVAVPDSGINPYHEAFHRPSLTQHPCTYIEGFPCDVPRLPLSIGEHESYEAAVEADQGLWDSVKRGTVYWIPKTNIIAAACIDPDNNRWPGCILDPDGHGTATSSAVITENPDALLAIQQGGPEMNHLEAAGIPMDIRSVSFGNIVPLPEPKETCWIDEKPPLYVIAAGNDPSTTLLDCWDGDPAVISVGGAYAGDEAEEPTAGKHPEVVSYYCRPAAVRDAIDAWKKKSCGTSIATPTVAGALSKVVLEIRRSTGYTGSLTDGMFDPEADLSIADLRDAMNRTASYDPSAKYEDDHWLVAAPLNPAAPWLQWGWGFYDGAVADVTLLHLLGLAEAPEKPAEAQMYMEGQQTVRQALYG